MNGLLTVLRVVAGVVMIGAALWAGFWVVSTSVEFGSANPGDRSGLTAAGQAIIGALAVYLVAGVIQRKRNQ